jgi:RNA polymerase sigma-70 factor (ECF subfamily)
MSSVPTEEIEKIVAAALAGDTRAESRMLVVLRPGVLAVLRFGAFHRWVDAEDLTQETLQIVVERVRARTIDDPRKVFSFAASTARNLALNAARKALRQQTIVDSELVDELAQNLEMEQSELSDTDDRHLAEAVVAMLEELPTERDRQMLTRFYLDGIDKQQLCRELGLSPKHFDRVLMRARSRLRTIIERRAPHLALFPRISGVLLALGMTFTFWVRHFGSW